MQGCDAHFADLHENPPTKQVLGLRVEGYYVLKSPLNPKTLKP